MKLQLLALLFLFVLANQGFSQEQKVELIINLLANDKIADVNLDQEKFIPCIGKITDYCDKNFNTIPKTQKIGILVIVHKSGKPTYKCYSDPQLDAATTAKILSDLDTIPMENTKIVDFPFFISVNSKNEGEITDFKDYEDPVKKQYLDFEAADLQTKFRLIKEYATNEVIPILNGYQVMVEDKFEGVKQFGKLVQATNFHQTQNIDNLTNKNKNYWRATMEMNTGNQLIPITKIAMLCSQGELDYALKYIEIVQIFSDPKTIANNYLEEIIYRLDLFYEELHQQIEKGIAEHDKGNYETAINIYNDILKIYPNSSWLLYERYFSDNTKKVADKTITLEDRKDWDIAKVEIFKHNPLYSMDVRASNGKEAYLIFRRQEVKEMFKNKDNRLADVFKYAEIATDLGVYDFAAQLFWLTATFDSKNSQESINNYLYCLDKLGEKELKSNFKGDFNKTFKSIADKKEKEMKNSSVYKSMKNK